MLEVETIEACKRMVLRKLGLAFLPRISVVEELRRGRLLPLEITDAESLRRSLDVIIPRRRPLSRSALELVKSLRAATHAVLDTRHKAKRRAG